MKSKKTMLILPVVVVALCAIALIGTGFASNYQGTTSNTGNNVDSVYVTISAGNDVADYTASFTETIEYNTIRGPDGNNITTTYEPIGTTKLNNKTVTAVALGSIDLTINLVKDITSLRLTMSHESQAAPTGTYYVSWGNVEECVVYESGTTVYNFTDIATINGNDKANITITLYQKVDETSKTAPTNGMTDVTFKFVVSASDEPQNNP